MAKLYKRSDERAKFRIVSDGGGATLDFEVEGNVVDGMTMAFEFLPQKRRTSLLIALEAAEQRLRAAEAQTPPTTES